jgi:hypothetical protein
LSRHIRFAIVIAQVAAIHNADFPAQISVNVGLHKTNES